MSPTITAPRVEPRADVDRRADSDIVEETTGPARPDWRDRLRAVEIADDLRWARIADHELHAESARQLQSQLAVALYDHLHAGRGPQDDHRPRRPRDRDLEARFAATVPADRCLVTARIVRGPQSATTDGADAAEAVVEHAGTRLRVPVRALVAPTDRAGIQWTTGSPVRLSISARRPALSPGFYLVDGPRPIPPGTRHLLRLYVHLDSAEAGVDALAAVLGQLHAADLPHRVKVLSAPTLYPRRDALVVYLPPSSWDGVPELLERLRDLPGRSDATSSFARRLAPGIAVAMEPRDAGRAHAALSFGQHRGVVCATALIESRSRGTDLDTDLDAEIDRQCRLANIDPTDPSRNLDSPALPPIG